MTEVATVLPATAEDAVAHLRAAAQALASAEKARVDALAAVREAVMAARVMKVHWDTIGTELGVSRQAAAERFGGDVRSHLVSAWHRIDLLLSEIALERRFKGSAPQLLQLLEDEGEIPRDIVVDALKLYEARNTAVHSVSPVIGSSEADRLTDVAIPLNGMLWMLQHSQDPDDSDLLAGG